EIGAGCVSLASEILFSSLQLAFELVEKAPIGAVGDDLLWVRLDHAGFMQAQRVKPESVLVIVLTPFVVGQLAKCLLCGILARGEGAVDELPCNALPVGDAEIGGFKNGAQNSLGRNRIFADKLAIAGEHAAEILRPGPINRTVDHDMADMPGPQ